MIDLETLLVKKKDKILGFCLSVSVLIGYIKLNQRKSFARKNVT